LDTIDNYNVYAVAVLAIIITTLTIHYPSLFTIQVATAHT